MSVSAFTSNKMEIRPTSERQNIAWSADRSPEGLVHWTPKNIAITLCLFLSVAVIAAVIGAVTAILVGRRDISDDDHTASWVSTTPNLPSDVTKVGYPFPSSDDLNPPSVLTTPNLPRCATNAGNPSPKTRTCQTITDNFQTFKNFLNLTMVTSDIKEDSEIYDLNAIVADTSYLLVMTQNVLYVYLMNDDGTLDKVQNISGKGDFGFISIVFSSEYFVFDGRHYVIISSHYTKTSTDTTYYVNVYSWDGTKLTVDGIVNLVTYEDFDQYSSSWSFIESTGHGQVFLANSLSSEWEGLDTHHTLIYIFNCTHFNHFQDIYTGMNTGKVLFFQTDVEDLYLSMGSSESPETETSFVYKYNSSSSKFEHHQTLPIKGSTSDMVIFDIEDETYLMQTLYYSVNYRQEAASPLYLWNKVSSEFEIHQIFITTYGQAACHIEYCDQHYLIIINFKSDVIMYKWDGHYFVEFNVLYKYAGTPLRACHVFYANGTPYLAVDKSVYIVAQV